jgi:hypothetical protein
MWAQRRPSAAPTVIITSKTTDFHSEKLQSRVADTWRFNDLELRIRTPGCVVTTRRHGPPDRVGDSTPAAMIVATLLSPCAARLAEPDALTAAVFIGELYAGRF